MVGEEARTTRQGTGAFRTTLPVREPELAELRAFCAAATLGSIAEAARSLSVSQPALSKRLRALETVVGAELFARSSRGVTLTAAGAVLYGAARRLLVSADTVAALIHNPGGTAPVRIWASATIAEVRLPAVLTEVARVETEAVIELSTANSPVVRELIRERRGDLGIAAVDPYSQPDGVLEERVIWRDEVVIGVPAGHPWRGLEEVPMEEFARTPLVQRDPWSNSSRVVATSLERLGVELVRPAVAIGSTEAMIEIALATRTPALLSLMTVRHQGGRGLVERRVAGIRFDREYALVWSGQFSDLAPNAQVIAQHLLDLPFARVRSAGEPGDR